MPKIETRIYRPADLEDIEGRLRKAADDLEHVRRLMVARGVSSLDIPYAASLRAGLQKIGQCVAKAAEAYYDVVAKQLPQNEADNPPVP